MYRKNQINGAHKQKRRKQQPSHQDFDGLYWDCLKTSIRVIESSSKMVAHPANEDHDQAFTMMLETIVKHLEKKEEMPIRESMDINKTERS